MPFDNPHQPKISAKEKILLTAHRLFYTYGIKNTGIDKIIEDAKVTKVTFYRHYPSKNELIISYLEYRHYKWMNWFEGTLEKQIATQSSVTNAILETMREWFSHPEFRGCAFINATAEAGELISRIQDISRDHKEQVAKVLNNYLPIKNLELARQLVLVLDGATVHMQMGVPLEKNLSLTEKTLHVLIE